MEPDFSGYATKAGIKCSDGLTITPHAFVAQDAETVPLVWNHGHSSAQNVLGHAILEAREDGMYAYGFFNETANGKDAKACVQHGDVKALSIFANQLSKQRQNVVHGAIREVSLVLAGANSGAYIDFVQLAHSDGDIETIETEAEISMGLPLEYDVIQHSGTEEDESLEHAAADKSLAEIYNTLTDEQKSVVEFMIGAALEQSGGDSVAQSAVSLDEGPQAVYDALTPDQKVVVHSMIDEEVESAKASAIAEHSALDDKEGNTMQHNVFEGQGQTSDSLAHAAMMEARSKLTPDVIKQIVGDMSKFGSLKESFIAHADTYGIDNIDVLFPDAKLDQNGVSIISRRMAWVNTVLSGTRHSPFSRIKSVAADITADEARAKGYVKGDRKKEEVIKMLKRVTTPKTIYKKQKLDRDDILDITDLDIVAWLKAEMRIMLDEELARAVLIGDGRDADDEDKIDEDHIRPIAFDDSMYTIVVNLPTGVLPADLVDLVVSSLDDYKGTGIPTLFTTQKWLTGMLLTRDTLGRRVYPTKNDLAAALLVEDIVPVEVMAESADIVGVLVNLADYTIGADAGGNVAMFDDFDIDFNQQKYLIETRVSGALTKPQSAVVLRRDAAHVVTPQNPTFVNSTGVITIPSVTGVVYKNHDTGATLTAGAQSAISVGTHVEIDAVAAPTYGLTHNADKNWEFTRTT